MTSDNIILEAAKAVDKLVRDPKAMDHWRAQCKVFFKAMEDYRILNKGVYQLRPDDPWPRSYAT